ncbi:tripartite tricarboxylate transporter TctB family protein [Pseudotabrizicola alkalilacus]|uniref:Tripartite tricarboxylate transporter TctB family protein n=1 Tax=Pseudotabrizicola alkalilacus TaxID=2305252 RepID=A0A411YWC8_9RHOB|nr:tripartite tricarboxylate transporter TctB family protein [Pseudotabrizicola alkalilacus]RGP35146.1 tripartite tricarboxylate transporter TctB family protein [Pseudotabrizicola alkalilacus]
MQIHDTVIGTLLALLGIAVVWHVSSFPSVAGQIYGPDLFPRLTGIGLLIFGGMLVLRGLRTAQGRWKGLAMPDAGTLRLGALAALYILVAVLALVLFGETLGFQILVFIILLVGLIASFRRPVASLTLAVVLTVAFDMIFRVLLRVPVPSGVLTGVL